MITVHTGFTTIHKHIQEYRIHIFLFSLSPVFQPGLSQNLTRPTPPKTFPSNQAKLQVWIPTPPIPLCLPPIPGPYYTERKHCPYHRRLQTSSISQEIRICAGNREREEGRTDSNSVCLYRDEGWRNEITEMTLSSVHSVLSGTSGRLNNLCGS